MSVLSVVLPAYNEELMIAKTCSVLKQVLTDAEIAYELVLVNDGSRDRTWEEIEKAGKKDPHIMGIHFSRNFGKEAAVFAGLAQATGDAVAVMDCDLQHPPQALVEMYRLWEQGYEVIEGVKTSRGKESAIHKKCAGFFYGCDLQHPPQALVEMYRLWEQGYEVIEGVKTSRGKESAIHKKCAGFFYGIMSKATKVDMQNASDFKLMDRKAVDSILTLPERNMFFRATSSWVGYKTASVEFEVQEREAGESKWSTWSLIKYAFTNIVAFTTVPLQFVTVSGGVCFIFFPCA